MLRDYVKLFSSLLHDGAVVSLSAGQSSIRKEENQTAAMKYEGASDALAFAEDVMLSDEGNWSRLLDVLRVSETLEGTDGSQYDMSLDDVIRHFKGESRKTVSNSSAESRVLSN